MSTRMKLVNSVEIDAPREMVFDYIANIANDPNWRSEVDRMDVKGPVELGTLAVEYSTLFRPFMKTTTPTKIAILDRPSTVAFETEPGVEPWLLSHRSLNTLNENRTKMTYRLETDLPGRGWFGKIYRTLIVKIYGPRLPRYLLELKKIIESEHKNNNPTSKRVQ